MNLRDLLAETRGNILRDVSTAVDGRVADGALFDFLDRHVNQRLHVRSCADTQVCVTSAFLGRPRVEYRLDDNNRHQSSACCGEGA